MPRLVSEPEFQFRLWGALDRMLARLLVPPRSVMGPGRSGQVAAVYASHALGIPWLPPNLGAEAIPLNLRPVLVIDTAVQTGKTLRKLSNRLRRAGVHTRVLVVFREPPMVRFWYEDMVKFRLAPGHVKLSPAVT